MLAFLCTTEALQIVNDIMQPVNFECPDGESITVIQSWHSDWHNDREWAFGCSKVPEPATVGNCQWTDWLYQLGTHDWQYSCNGNSVIKGWYSEHHDWWDTRKHKLQCCEVLTPVLICQKFLPLLKKATESRSSQPMSYSKAAIINVSSLMSSIDSSLKTRGNSYHYRASKAALNMVTALMSVELKSFGILAAAIHPGWVKTDMGGPGADLDKKLLVDHHQHVGEVIG
ncbi:hypothetical protein BaRGS_00040060, partial [Batillaria attramentaria]